MCGGGLTGEILHPIVDLATAYFGGPIAEAALQTGEGLAGGQGLGKSLERGALSGAETFGGQEIAGALGNAVGATGAGGNSLTDLLGMTQGAGSLTGPGTAGAQFGDLINGNSLANLSTNIGLGGTATPSSSTGNTIPTSTATTAPTSTPSAGTAGGGTGGAGGGAAPASVDTSGATGLPWQTDSLNSAGAAANTTVPASSVGQAYAGTSVPGETVNNTGNLSQVGSPASSSNIPGSTSIGSQFAQGLGGSSSLNTSGIDSLASAANAANGASGVPTQTSLGKLFSEPFSVSNVGNVITSNPGAAISAAGLGLDALKGNKQSGAEKNLESQASQLGQQGNQLEGYLQSGTLPSGLQAGLNQAKESAKATIRSQYASMGLSGSSAEQQALSQVDMQAQAQSAQMAEQLLTTGINETGMASQLYQDLIKNQMTNDSNLSNAVSNFASASSGGGIGGSGISAAQLLKLTGAGGNA